MTVQRVGVMQVFTRPQKRRLRDQRAQQTVEVAVAQRTETSTVIQREVALSWIGGYYAERAAERMSQLVSVATDQVAVAESAYRQGRGNAADVLTARGELLQLEDDNAGAALRVRTARIALSRWLGDAADRPLAGKPSIDALPFQQDSIETHLRGHPDLESLLREEDLAQTEVELARAERRPDWTVELSYGHRGALYSDLLSIGVSVPIPAFHVDRQDRLVAAKVAEAKRAKARRQDMFQEHLADARMLIERWETTRQRRTRFTDMLVPLAADRVVATTAAYRGGQTQLGEVMAALRHAADVDLQVLELEAETATLWAQLAFLVPQAGDQ
jgi:outer membrane protein TolC